MTFSRIRASAATVIAAVMVAGLAAVSMPGVAQADDWEAKGANDAQLKVTPSDDLPEIATVQVSGQGFVPGSVAHIAECSAAFTFTVTDCQAIGTAPTDAGGSFSVAAEVSAIQANFICANRSTEPCQVVASTDELGVVGQRSQASHHVCFAGSVPCNGGATTTSTSAPTTTTTSAPTTTSSTVPAPSAAPCTLRETAFPHPPTDYPDYQPPSPSSRSNLPANLVWKRESTAGPSAREGAAMAYDPGRRQTVLFGGFSRTEPCVKDDTWTWDGITWAHKDPVHRPPARYGHAMAYDGTQVVLFGGYDGLKDLGDTWTWDGSDWVAHGALATAPSPRARAAMSFDGIDPARPQVVLFGGDHETKILGDTWVWEAGAWLRQAPLANPPTRGYATMAFDAATNQVLLVSGWHGTALADTWAWNRTAWTLVNYGYNNPYAHSGAMAYDPSTGQVVFQPGSDLVRLDGGPGYQESAYGAAWDGARWADSGTNPPVGSPSGPPGRSFAAMATDAAGQVVLFGGYGPETKPLSPAQDYCVGFTGGSTTCVPTQRVPASDNADRADTWTMVTPGTGSPTPTTDEHISIALDPPEIAADGTSTAKVTATVTRAGVGEPGKAVNFTTSGDVRFSQASGATDANGVATTTITASKTPDFETITATASNQSTADDLVFPSDLTAYTVLVEKGLTLSLDPVSVPADGSSTSRATATLSESGPLDEEQLCFSTDGDVTFSAPGSPPGRPDCGERTGEHTWATTIVASLTGGQERITVTSKSGLSASAVLDEGGSQWSDLSASASGPTPPRSEAAMVYDAANHQTVLFGGLDGSHPSRLDSNKPLGDTWTWDGKIWTQQDPANAPSARYAHAMAYDASSGQVVLFGGWGGSEFLRDTWTWDGKAKTWTQRGPGPSPRYHANMASDATGVVLFSGTDGFAYDNDGPTDPNGPGHLADTWTWRDGAWAQQHPATSPPGRGRAAMAYHPPSGKVVLYGGTEEFQFSSDPRGNPAGASVQPVADTWTWDGTTWAQQGAGTNPGPRHSGAMAYDASTGQLMLFGGTTSSYALVPRVFNFRTSSTVAASEPDYAGQRGDTWTWDGGAWAAQSPPISPSARESQAMAQNPSGGVVLFSGFVPDRYGAGSFPDDTWTWDPRVSLVLSPRAVPADGTATSVATARVTDANGRPMTGLQGVSFSTDGDVRFSAATEAPDGAYTSTVTASGTGDIETVSVHTPVGSASATLNEVARVCSAPQPSTAPGTWATVSPMPAAVYSPAAAAGADGRIYVFGGQRDVTASESGTPGFDATGFAVQEYDPCTNSWQTLPSIPGGARAWAAATRGPDGRIYLTGGSFAEAALAASAAVEVYTAGVGDIPGHWETLPPMQTARTGPAAAVGPDGRLYVSGGQRSIGNPGQATGAPLDTVEAYSPDTHSWAQVKPMSTPRAWLGSATAPDGRVFAIGGSNADLNDVNTVEAYDGPGDRWQPVAPMSHPRSMFAAASDLDGRIYAISGASRGLGPVDSVEAYDGCSGVWAPATPMSAPRSQHAAATGPDGRIYVMGGTEAHSGGGPTDYIFNQQVGLTAATTAVEAYTPDPSTRQCPKVSIDDVTVTEPSTGTAPARFTVSLDRPALQAVTVDYQTYDGTAKAGTDYVATKGTLTFAAGQTSPAVGPPDPSQLPAPPPVASPSAGPAVPELSKTIDVAIQADQTPEAAETFSVRLSLATPATATLARPQGTATILDGAVSTGTTTTAVTPTTVVHSPVPTTSSTSILPATRVPVSPGTTLPQEATTSTTAAPATTTTTSTTSTTVPETPTTTIPGTTTTTTAPPPVTAPPPPPASGATASPPPPVGPQTPPPPLKNPDPLHPVADQSQPTPPPISQVAPVLLPLVQPAPPPPPPPAPLAQPLTQAQAQSQAQQQAQSQSQQQAQQQSQAQAQQQVQAAAQPAMMEERERQAQLQQAHATETGNHAGTQTHLASARRRPATVPPAALAWLASLAALGLGLASRNGERAPARQPVRHSADGLMQTRRRRRRRGGGSR